MPLQGPTIPIALSVFLSRCALCFNMQARPMLCVEVEKDLDQDFDLYHFRPPPPTSNLTPQNEAFKLAGLSFSFGFRPNGGR